MPIHGYPGGVISATAPTISPTSASGVWTLDDQLQNAANWPSQSNIARSLRFNSADSAYLNRTPSVAGDRQKFTWSGWVKRCVTGADQQFMAQYTDASNRAYFNFRAADTFLIFNRVSGVTTCQLETTQVFRDVSSWYHVVLAVDTTQATNTNRVKLYINGSQVTAFGTSTYPSQNDQFMFNSTNVHRIGSYDGAGDFFNGYMADVYFIDGQALTPSSFGYTDSNGIWQPNSYTGSYGTNGFWLNFDDNSGTTATTLGKDSSGNGNNWTPNNFSVTAGTGNDSLVDSPTNYGTDTGVGGEVRGNYATMNPLQMGSGASLANGNLDATSTAATGIAYSTIGVSTGKWYWEVTNGEMIGISKEGGIVDWRTATGYAYFYFNGQKYTNGSGASYGATFTTSDTIGVALDMDAGTLTFYKNGVSQGVAFSGLSGTYFASLQNPGASTSNSTFNFGQRPFAYTAPAGFKALCSTNLPTPTIQKGGSYFNTVLYTGTLTSVGQNQPVSGVGFQPDMTWIKCRSNAANNIVADSLRYVSTSNNNTLSTNTTDAEADDQNTFRGFDSDGFNVGYYDVTGNTGKTYVAWNWKAGGTGVTNTAGSITSTVSANQTSGFSVVTFTSPTSGAFTVGHGLGAAPSMFIWKARTIATDWAVYHASLGNAAYLRLQSDAAAVTGSSVWSATTPSSSVVYISNDLANLGTVVLYCFAAVPGYSAFGSYTGNGSTDGPFVYTGFRPRWVLFKLSSAAGGNWFLFDSVRSTYNVVNNLLYPNGSNAENTSGSGYVDFTSNGFKIRTTSGDMNTNNYTYVYAAFAENPFKIARAR